MKSLLLLALSVSAVVAIASPAPAPSSIPSLDLWKSAQFPFDFKYAGKDSSSFLSSWQRTDETLPSPDGQLHRYTFVDPATHLKIVAEVRTFNDFDAIDWVLKFTNEGSTDTPILEDILPLRWTIPCDFDVATLHSTKGSGAAPDDFAPRDIDLHPHDSTALESGQGRSSDNAFPFFNLQMGGHGLIGAIGWTGSWMAHFNRDTAGKTISMDAGLRRTRLLLHPGETIRTPRILMMNWNGDRTAAQNTWRQLMLTGYSPKDLDGKTATMPICWDTWGTERASAKLAIIQGMRDRNIPADLYWIDAGWYEPITLPPGKDVDSSSPWAVYRGDWIVSKSIYPSGMKPIGDALKSAGIGFLLWIEAETANQGAHRFQEHPNWYLQQPGRSEAFLNLGNPDAYKSITDQVSGIIESAGLTWYRQDFNFIPTDYWAAADTPDRIGMSEIKSIMGLYAYWDELRARHPGLRIDNCASGGRRLDIETMSRSVALWRSDDAGDPIHEQFHTGGVMPWIPLTSGVWITIKGSSPPPGSAAQLYQQRSAYCAGMTVCIDQTPAPWLKTAFDEFHEVRPYFLGDFHLLLPPVLDETAWAAWQLQKRDHNSGIAVCLRRPGNPYSALELNLQAIDPQAQYDVEVRAGIDKAKVQTMPGKALAKLRVEIPDAPGSALVFYSRH